MHLSNARSRRQLLPSSYSDVRSAFPSQDIQRVHRRSSKTSNSRSANVTLRAAHLLTTQRPVLQVAGGCRRIVRNTMVAIVYIPRDFERKRSSGTRKRRGVHAQRPLPAVLFLEDRTLPHAQILQFLESTSAQHRDTMLQILKVIGGQEGRLSAECPNTGSRPNSGSMIVCFEDERRLWMAEEIEVENHRSDLISIGRA